MLCVINISFVKRCIKLKKTQNINYDVQMKLIEIENKINNLNENLIS